mgnify:CR=1 FL=1
MIEQAYTQAGELGLDLWCEDEAGPFRTAPVPGNSWQPEGHPAHYDHEYVRRGTAKLLTLFHPATGAVRAKGVTNAPNVVLHPWLREELLAKVWGYARNLDIETRTVDIHIAKLRRKIEADPRQPRNLVTVRGAGYRLDVGD